MLRTQPLYALDERVRAAAAWIRLEIDRSDFISCSEPVEQPLPSHLVIDVRMEQAIAAFEHLRRTGDTSSGELCAQQSVPRGLSGMYAFDFRAFVQILTDAARETAGETECIERLFRIELCQIR